MQNLTHKIMVGSVVANTIITTLAFFYLVVQEIVL
jgi:hypothetical protein